jgi:hypothetical protein
LAGASGASSITGATVSASGNITGGNVLTGGLISATGNVTGNYILGNGALLTGVITSVANINNGTSNVTVVSSGGNVTVGVGGTSNVAVFATSGEYVTGVVSASGNVTGGNLLTGGLVSAAGTITGTSHLGSVVSVTANVTGGNVLTAGVVSATGNVTGNYFIGNGSQLTGISATSIANGTSNVSVVSSGGNITVGVNGYSNVAVFGTNTLSLSGPFATPKTINSNVLVANAVNAILVSPVTVGALGNIFVPNDATLTIFTPA